MKPAGQAWPPHRQEPRPWAQTHRGGTRDDRTLRSIAVSLPPFIAGRTVALDSETAADLEAATSEITKLDGAYADDLSALGTLLLRTESVASSKIEHIQASVDDYARALHGVRANSSAVAMAAATSALEAMIGTVGPDAPIPSLQSLRPTQHSCATILRNPRPQVNSAPCRTGSAAATSPHEVRSTFRRHRKRCRAIWTTSSPSPTATTCRCCYRLPSHMRSSSRSTPSPTATAASAEPSSTPSCGVEEPLLVWWCRWPRHWSHAVTTTSMRWAATARVTLLHYWAPSYAPPKSPRPNRGSPRNACTKSPASGGNFTGPVRRGSAAAKILNLLPGTPILSSDDAVALVDAPRSSVFDAIGRLREAGVLRALTDRKRDQIWGAGLVLDELEDLGGRIAMECVGSGCRAAVSPLGDGARRDLLPEVVTPLG